MHYLLSATTSRGRKLQVDDDIEAEARQRVTGLVSTASRHRKEQSGVWAPFGKPYQALGKVETVRAGGVFLVCNDLRGTLAACFEQQPCGHPCSCLRI